MVNLNACSVAKLANQYAKSYKGSIMTNADCDSIRTQLLTAFSVPVSVRVFCFNPQKSSVDPTAWPVNAFSSNVTTQYESVIPRPELMGTLGRAVPGCPSKSSNALRTSATTGITTFYGVGQVKDSSNCTVQQVLKIAIAPVVM